MDIPDTELQKLALWRCKSRKRRKAENCNQVCIPKMMKKYLKLVHHLLTQIGFQYVSSQSSVRILLRRTGCQQLQKMRGIPRTGFMSQFSKSCNFFFFKAKIKFIVKWNIAFTEGFKRITTHYSEKQRINHTNKFTSPLYSIADIQHRQSPVM
jgi:hypothetical protein